MSNERFLVTGALGCLGAWTVRNLVHEQVPVVAFDLGNDRYRLRLIMSDAELAQVQFVQGDITDFATLERTVVQHNITHIIHLAAILFPTVKANPHLGAQVNLMGTVNLLEVARRHTEIQQLVYASSIAVYAQDAVPTGEVVRSDTPREPENMYGVLKRSAEEIARLYHVDHAVRSIGLRPGTIFGVGRDNGITAAPTQAIEAVLKGASFHIPYGGRGEFQYADDVAKTFIQAAKTPFDGAEVFNLHGTVAGMQAFIDTVESILPQAIGKITFQEPGFPSPEAYDDRPLQAVIGPVSVTPLEAAIHETAALFKQI